MSLVARAGAERQDGQRGMCGGFAGLDGREASSDAHRNEEEFVAMDVSIL